MRALAKQFDVSLGAVQSCLLEAAPAAASTL
jgi:hypothetical protein